MFTAAKPVIAPAWQRIFDAFTPIVWGLTVAFTVLIGISFYFIYRFDTQHNSIAMDYALGVAFKVLCQEGISHKYPKAGAIILLGIWMLGSTLIVTFYIGAMQSLILVPGLATKPIDTLEELSANTDVVLQIRWGYGTVVIYPYPDLMKRNNPISDYKDLMISLLENPNTITIRDRTAVIAQSIFEQLEPIGKNPYYYSRNTLLFTINTWIVRKDCPFQNDFTKVLMEAQEFGFVTYYTKKMSMFYRKRVSKYGDMMPQSNEDAGLITLPYFFALCPVIIAGYISSIICFSGEKAFQILNKWRLRKRG